MEKYASSGQQNAILLIHCIYTSFDKLYLNEHDEYDMNENIFIVFGVDNVVVACK